MSSSTGSEINLRSPTATVIDASHIHADLLASPAPAPRRWLLIVAAAAVIAAAVITAAVLLTEKQAGATPSSAAPISITAASSASVSGVVRDGANGSPIPGVRIVSSIGHTSTGANGSYVLPVSLRGGATSCAITINDCSAIGDTTACNSAYAPNAMVIDLKTTISTYAKDASLLRLSVAIASFTLGGGANASLTGSVLLLFPPRAAWELAGLSSAASGVVGLDTLLTARYAVVSALAGPGPPRADTAGPLSNSTTLQTVLTVYVDVVEAAAGMPIALPAGLAPLLILSSTAGFDAAFPTGTSDTLMWRTFSPAAGAWTAAGPVAPQAAGAGLQQAAVAAAPLPPGIGSDDAGGVVVCKPGETLQVVGDAPVGGRLLSPFAAGTLSVVATVPGYWAVGEWEKGGKGGRHAVMNCFWVGL